MDHRHLPRTFGILCAALLLTGCGTLLQSALDDLTNPRRKVWLEAKGEPEKVSLHSLLEGYADREEREEAGGPGNRADGTAARQPPGEGAYERAETVSLPAREVYPMRRGDLLRLRIVPQGSGPMTVTLTANGKPPRIYALRATAGLPIFIEYEL